MAIIAAAAATIIATMTTMTMKMMTPMTMTMPTTRMHVTSVVYPSDPSTPSYVLARVFFHFVYVVKV